MLLQTRMFFMQLLSLTCWFIPVCRYQRNEPWPKYLTGNWLVLKFLSDALIVECNVSEFSKLQGPFPLSFHVWYRYVPTGLYAYDLERSSLCFPVLAWPPLRGPPVAGSSSCHAAGAWVLPRFPCCEPELHRVGLLSVWSRLCPDASPGCGLWAGSGDRRGTE